MPNVPVDLGLLIRQASSYKYEAVVERLKTDAIPRFFKLLQAGDPISYSELQLAILCTPGVRRARLVRLSRATDAGGIPPEKLEFTADELPTLGQVEIDFDPEATQTPFATS